MPKFLENKLEKEYGKGSPIVYATMNKLGYMHGNKTTKKGQRAEAQHKSIKKNIKWWNLAKHNQNLFISKQKD